MLKISAFYLEKQKKSFVPKKNMPHRDLKMQIYFFFIKGNPVSFDHKLV